ncbi:MAG: hypothetical protein HQL29_02730 [Candidatus Omnitrophica bacterium]|nr:hypothetical protein [Candidatus Omnitrophota bacterium]
MKKIISLLTAGIFFFSCFLPGTDSFADDSATATAVKELMGALSNFLGDSAKMTPMTDEKKIKYMLEEAKKRIWEATEKQSIGLFKEKLKEYAKQRIQTDIFKKRVTKMLMEAIIEDKNVGALWSKASAEIASELDTKMKAIGHSIDALDTGYTVYKEWSTGGAEKGLRKMGTEVADKIMEYFIPGWGYYRLAQSLVEALGEYVMAYAFDAAFQAKLKILLPVQPSDKAAFAKWILNTDINSYVTREWDEQLAYSGFYAKYDGNTKTKEEGGDAMKKALINHLQTLKDELKKKEQIKNELEEKIRQEEEKTREAEKAVKAVTQKTLADAEVYLSLIQRFEENFLGYKKIDAKNNVTKKEKEYSEYVSTYSKGQSVTYSPMDKSSILSALEAVGNEVKEDGTGGYDEEAANRLYDHYFEVRKNVIDQSSQEIAQKQKAAQDAVARINAVYQPQHDAAAGEYNKARTPEERASKLHAVRNIGDAWGNATSPYMHAYNGGLTRDQAKDIEVLSAMENLVMTEILARGRVMQQNIIDAIDGGGQKLREALDDFNLDYGKVVNEIGNEMYFGGYWRYSEGCLNAVQKQYSFHDVGTYESALRDLEELRDNLIKDTQTAPRIYVKEKAMYEKYYKAVTEVISKYEETVPANLRVLQGDNESGKSICGSYGAHSFFITANKNSRYNRRSTGIITNDRYTGFSVRTPSYQGTIEEMMDNINKDPFNGQKAMEYLNKSIAEMKPKAEADRDVKVLVNVINRVSEEIMKFEMYWEPEKIKKKALKLFGQGGNILVDPEDSEGARYIDKMKEFWENNSKLVDVLVSLKKNIGTTLVSYSWFSLKDHYYTQIESYAGIPQIIEFYETKQKEAIEEYNKRISSLQNNYKNARERYEKIKDAPGKSLRQIEEELLSIENSATNNLIMMKNVKENPEIKKIVEEWTKLQETIIEYRKELDKKSGASGGSAGGGTGLQGKPESPEPEKPIYKPENFDVNDPSVNGRPVGNRTGTFIIEKKDAPGGKLTITADLPNVREYASVLISEDSGNSWKPIPLNSKISYSFNAVPEKKYKPFLQIKTDTGREVIVDIFKGIDGIVYKDLDYMKEVQDAIVKMADAYEKRDVFKFMEYVARDFAGNRNTLEEGVRTDFDMFMDTRLSIYINRINTSGGNYIAEIKWDKKQVPKKTMREQRTSGNTSFIFINENGKIKLKNLRGNLIYATLSPEIAETSGLPSGTVDDIRKARDERNGQQPGAGKVEDSGGAGGSGDGGGGLGGGPGEPGGRGIAASNIESGNFSLTQTAFHPPMSNQGFDFSGRRVVTEVDNSLVDRTSADFKRREGWLILGSGVGFVPLGVGSIDGITEVPASGYSSGPGDFREGRVYAISMPDGTYAVVQSISTNPAWGMPQTTTFKYKYQKNGSRNFN